MQPAHRSGSHLSPRSDISALNRPSRRALGTSALWLSLVLGWVLYRGIPAQCPPGPNRVLDADAGLTHAVILRLDGSVWAWGDNVHGQLGTGNPLPFSVSPTPVAGLPAAVAVSTGNHHTLAIAGGAVWAWGRNDVGQLGDGTTTSRATPAPVTGLAGTPIAIAAGGDHNLALTIPAASGVPFQLWAWGDNSCGQLGQGSLGGFLSTPATVLAGVQTIAAGADHSVAVVAGAVMTWGRNDLGQLGIGSSCTPPVGTFCCGVPTPTPVNLPPFPVAIHAGGNHTMVIAGGGIPRVFGDNTFGQLGLGTTGNFVPTPTLLPLPPPLTSSIPTSMLPSPFQAGLGLRHSLMTIGAWVWAWGDHASGQLGVGNAAPALASPALVGGLGSSWQVAAGGDFSLVVRDVATIMAFGANGRGQLGAPTTVASRNRPDRVAGVAAPLRGFVAVPGSPDPIRLWAPNIPCVAAPAFSLDVDQLAVPAETWLFASLGPPPFAPSSDGCGQNVYLDLASAAGLIGQGVTPWGPAAPQAHPLGGYGTSLPVALPPSLSGLQLTVQAVALHGTFACGYALSNGLELVIQ